MKEEEKEKKKEEEEGVVASEVVRKVRSSIDRCTSGEGALDSEFLICQ